jgi:hypothetical protein
MIGTIMRIVEGIRQESQRGEEAAWNQRRGRGVYWMGCVGWKREKKARVPDLRTRRLVRRARPRVWGSGVLTKEAMASPVVTRGMERVEVPR